MKGNRMTRYFSENHQRFLNIANMTDQHVRNAFVKMCKNNKDIVYQDTRYAQEQENRAERLQDKVIELKKDNDLLKQACLRAKKDNISLKEENQRLSSCYKIGEVLSERDKKDSKMDIDAKDRRIAYLEKLLQAKNYVFSDIPNTPENMKMIKLLKKHVNKDMYRVRWRGQYLVDGEDWRKYTDGQPLSKSKCIRVYIDNLSAYGSTEGFNLDEIGIILDGLHKVSEQSEEFIRSFDIEGENDEDVNAEKLSLQKTQVLRDYFEEMKFHIEECQQKMSEIE
jgi:DNA-binding transcriptional MerR regulator